MGCLHAAFPISSGDMALAEADRLEVMSVSFV